MKSAFTQYKEELKTKKAVTEDNKKAKLRIKWTSETILTKRKAKYLFEKAIKKARLGHMSSASK